MAMAGRRGVGIISSMTASVSAAIRSTMKFTLIAWEMWWMKYRSHPTQAIARIMPPDTVATGEKGVGMERAAGRAAVQ